MTPRGVALPHTDGLRLPPRWMLHGLRPLASWLIRRYCRVVVHGADRLPASGPVIVAANHIGAIDGPLLAIFTPRPVHALTKIEAFSGTFGWFFKYSGQVPLDRFHADPAAVKASLALLRAGRCLGIFPEGTRGRGDLAHFNRGAAYLALTSGAPVVPLTVLGTREPGARSGSMPRRGGRIDLVFGQPFRVEAQSWPRTREQVGQTSVLLREHMVAGLAAALALTGSALPGDLPTSDHDGETRTSERGA